MNFDEAKKKVLADYGLAEDEGVVMREVKDLTPEQKAALVQWEEEIKRLFS